MANLLEYQHWILTSWDKTTYSLEKGLFGSTAVHLGHTIVKQTYLLLDELIWAATICWLQCTVQLLFAISYKSVEISQK